MTAVGIVMIADAELIQPHAGQDVSVEALDHFLFCGAAGYVRLVGHSYEQKTGAPEEETPLDDSLDEPHISDIRGRIGLPIADNGFIEHAVPVEKYCPIGP